MGLIETVGGESKGELPTRLTKSSAFYQKLSRSIQRPLKYLPSQRRYNLTISSEARFVWFRVAKCGTRSLLRELADSGIQLDAAHPYNCYYPERLYEDYFKFAFVRNPWDRLVSCWANKVVDSNYFSFDTKTRSSFSRFPEFVRGFVANESLHDCDPHIRLQKTLIDLNNIDFLGRLEHFSEDLDYVREKLGVKRTAIKKVNASSRDSDYRRYYDDATADVVGRLYEQDVGIFGYSF